MSKLTKHRKVIITKAVKKWRAKNPEKIKAQRLKFSALRNGRLTKESCKECGDSKSEAHHEDYAKPLDIVWLCKKHHVEADKKRKAREKLLTD